MKRVTLIAVTTLAGCVAVHAGSPSSFWNAARSYEVKGASWSTVCLTEPQPHCVKQLQGQPTTGRRPVVETYFVITPGKGVKGRVAHVSCIAFVDEPTKRDCSSWDDWFKGDAIIHQEQDANGVFTNTPWPY